MRTGAGSAALEIETSKVETSKRLAMHLTKRNKFMVKLSNEE
jgi:hypothetical protein